MNKNGNHCVKIPKMYTQKRGQKATNLCQLFPIRPLVRAHFSSNLNLRRNLFEIYAGIMFAFMQVELEIRHKVLDHQQNFLFPFKLSVSWTNFLIKKNLHNKDGRVKLLPKYVWEIFMEI